MFHARSSRALFLQQRVSGSPFIIKHFLTWEVKETRCFALEYVPGGDLFDVLKQERHFDSPRAAKYVNQLGQVRCA